MAEAEGIFSNPKNIIEMAKVVRDRSLVFVNEVLMYPLFISIFDNK
jgi:hypothetical protein